MWTVLGGAATVKDGRITMTATTTKNATQNRDVNRIQIPVMRLVMLLSHNIQVNSKIDCYG